MTCHDCHRQAEDGTRRCRRCREKRVRYMVRYRERLWHEGLCAECKKWNDRQPGKWCRACLRSKQKWAA